MLDTLRSTREHLRTRVALDRGYHPTDDPDHLGIDNTEVARTARRVRSTRARVLLDAGGRVERL